MINVNIRSARFASFVVFAGLAACSTGTPFSANRPEIGAPGAANPALGAGSRIACNASPDSNRLQFIVGYGSLMQEESRKRSSPQAGPAHPVEIEGYRRGWYARAESVGYSATYLGLLRDRESRLNAVIYQVDAAELAATDQREISYCRTSVAIPDIKSLETGFLPAPNAQTWIYVSKPSRVAAPNARYPIAQSYVDIFVSGCLEQEQRFGLADFSRQCLSTTAGWSRHWVNDRIYPRRPFIFQPRARQIDTLLSERLQPYFSHIRIEAGG